MKKFIYKTNQYLLERYPNLWNTKIVWMLGASAIIHVIFYILGFIALTNVKTLHERRAVEMFFENGTIFFSVLISIIILVIWLTQMFKNNSFKNFYPTSRHSLFLQFVLYFIIILFGTTFYFSYMFGLKHYTNITYPDETFYKEVKTANNTAVFLSHSLQEYMINKRHYPSPYDSIYCETNDGLIDKSATFLEYYDKSYQFYTLYTKTIDIEDAYTNRKNYGDYVYYEDTDSTRTYFYKQRVVNINELSTTFDKPPVSPDSLSYTASPSYFNYSTTFFTPESNPLEFSLDYVELYNTKRDTKKRITRNKLNQDLLLKNNPEDIKTLLKSFLEDCDKYKIENNLTSDEWFGIINTTPEYRVTALIETSKPIKGSYEFEKERTALEKHIDKITTAYYIRSGDLQNVFENIDTIKNRQIINGAIHVFLWIAFFLSALIFCFRISNLRTFIFSVIGGAVLFLFTALIIAIYEYLSRGNRSEYFSIYFGFIITSIVIAIPIFYYDKIKKTLVGVFMNLSIVGFVPYVLLILGIITSHQSDYCSSLYPRKEDCFELLDQLGLIYTSLILFVAGFVFMYFYASIIKRWRALPEQ